VPDNYIEEMPTSIAVVRRNLRIVISILNPDEVESDNLQKKLIGPLKSEIYSKIDLFLANADVVLQEQVQNHFPLHRNQVSSPPCGDASAHLHTLLRDQLKNLDPNLAQWVKNILDDIDYIKQMKVLEEQFYDPESKKPGTGLSHIVPITGLIMGRFNRVENELRTVLNVWENRMPKEDSFLLQTHSQSSPSVSSPTSPRSHTEITSEPLSSTPSPISSSDMTSQQTSNTTNRHSPDLQNTSTTSAPNSANNNNNNNNNNQATLCISPTATAPQQLHALFSSVEPHQAPNTPTLITAAPKTTSLDGHSNSGGQNNRKKKKNKKKRLSACGELECVSGGLSSDG